MQVTDCTQSKNKHISTEVCICANTWIFWSYSFFTASMVALSSQMQCILRKDMQVGKWKGAAKAHKTQWR